MQFWVYILRCRDGSYYTGHTENLEKRLAEHEQGLGADWTRRRRPVELVWCDWAPSRDEVFAFERRVKNWSRAKKEALIAGDWQRVGLFARPPRERPSTSLGTSDSCAPRPFPSRERVGQLARPPHERPSTSLGTSEESISHPPPGGPGQYSSVRPERSRGARATHPGESE
ncbi:MAG TPA: GIY-YIG nuclease family protein [Allosphingosinicella sp.]|jgi:putative endonuclease